MANCIGDRAILNHKVSEEGSGFVGKEVTPLVSCSDGNFRPIDMQFALDGSLYIVDWHNALIGHLQHNLRDPNRDHSHGRIWRVTYKGRPLVKTPKIAGQPVAALLPLLDAPEGRTRYAARRELAQHKSADVIAAVGNWVSSLDKSGENYEHQLLEALWMYQTHNKVETKLLDQLLNAKDHRARAAATRVLSFWLDRVDAPLELLKVRINDSHPRVRLEAVRALTYLGGDDAIEAALDVLNHDVDDYLQYTLDEAIRHLER